MVAIGSAQMIKDGLKAISRDNTGNTGRRLCWLCWGEDTSENEQSKAELCIVMIYAKEREKWPWSDLILSFRSPSPFSPTASLFIRHVLRVWAWADRVILAAMSLLERGDFGQDCLPSCCDFRLLTEMSQGHFGDYVQMYLQEMNQREQWGS